MATHRQLRPPAVHGSHSAAYSARNFRGDYLTWPAPKLTSSRKSAAWRPSIASFSTGGTATRYGRIRQNKSAFVSIRERLRGAVALQHAYVSVRQRTLADACTDAPTAAPLSPHAIALFQPVQADPGAVFGQMHRSGSQ